MKFGDYPKAGSLDGVTGFRNYMQTLGLDMTATWAPTVASYFGRVSKERIIESVREGVSVEAAANIAGMKKQAMADAAEQRLAGTGWLPELLRTGTVIERETEQAA